MAPTYKIHPAIGVARVGDSPDEFYIAPETPFGLPIACDRNGNTTREDTGNGPGPEKTTSRFKDAQCRIKRQAARFKIYVYDEKNPKGRLLRPGDTIQGPGSSGKLVDIEWTVYLANKKAVWYQFEELKGEHGYQPDHPLRNEDIEDSTARQRLIIDPGPRTVHSTSKPRRASLDADNPTYQPSFPPPLEPRSIDTLGEILTDDDLGLLVLGGHGNSGTMDTAFGQPAIEHFANNEGWFDDVSDGPVTARLMYRDEEDQQVRYTQVENPAWVLVGQPGYVPELANLITLDDLVYDVAVRNFGYDTYLYGPAPYDEDRRPPVRYGTESMDAWRRAKKSYNPDYYPLFWKEIWPLLQRPNDYQWVTALLNQSFDPHDTTSQGNFDICRISRPPHEGQDASEREIDGEMRRYIYHSLRQTGEENRFKNDDAKSRLYGAPLMPLLCGDNPIDDEGPVSKFLVLTPTQLFLLRQWAEGKFVDECREGWVECAVDTGAGCKRPPTSYWYSPAETGAELDRVALAGCLGGSFCPGGEVSWILRNWQVFEEPYRIRANTEYLPGLETSSVATTPGVETYERAQLSQPTAGQPTPNPAADGLEPGDLTKYGPLPWQADFNECNSQTIDVTYERWNQTVPIDDDRQVVNETLWWPAHRPMEVANADTGVFEQWSRGIPSDHSGDLKMVTAWTDLGFVIRNPQTDSPILYIEVEHNARVLGGPSSSKDCQPKGGKK